MSRRTRPATSARVTIAAACILALTAVSCRSKSDEAMDKKIAELEQQLQAAKGGGAAPAGQKAEPGAPPEAAPAAQVPAAASTQPAGAPKSAPAGAPAAKPLQG